MAKFDPTRLIVQLQNTGLAIKDTPLFQLLFEMLRAMATINGEVNGIITGSGGGSGVPGSNAVINQFIQQLNLGADSDFGGDSNGLLGFSPSSTQAASSGGGGTGTDAFVPYYIAPTETFTVPEFKQALFAMNIDNEGDLVVDGFLIEVDRLIVTGGSTVVNNQNIMILQTDEYHVDD